MQAIATLSLDQKDEKSSVPLLFDLIYEIAKNAKNDKDTIKKLSSILTLDTCIDVRVSAGIQTPAAKLAKEGNEEAVDLLMKLGANINYIARGAALGGHRDYAEHLRLNHGANVSYIAWGAAIGGHRDYAEYLRLNHGANVSYIAWGAAQGDHRDYAEYLRLNHGANANDIARGAAVGGHHDYAEYLRINHGASVSYIAWGAAQGGHRDYAEHLRLNHGANVNYIAKGAALGGHRDYAEYLRLNHGANVNDIAKSAALGGHRNYAEYLRLNHGANVNDIARGAAEGGHRDYAEYLRLNHGANVNDIALAAAISGHRDYAEYLRLNHGANVNDIAWAAALGGHHDYAEYLHLNHAAKLAGIATGAVQGDNFANTRTALHSLCFMKNNNYRAQIAKEIKKQNLVPYDVTKLVPKAKRIAELRPKYNYSQCIALGNREIQTWYLQCAVLIGNGRGKLDPQLFLSIATYLSPLTLWEAGDLYKKSRFDMYQKLLVIGVDQYCVNTRTLFFFSRDTKAEEFSVACAQSKNSSQLIELLSAESKRINSDEESQQSKKVIPYNNIISRSLKRYGLERSPLYSPARKTAMLDRTLDSNVLPNHSNQCHSVPNGTFTGEIEPRMQQSLKRHVFYTMLAILGVAAFTLISFIGAPFVLTVLINAFFAGSVVHLTGISYGIVNDIIGCKKFLPYFSLGHQPQQKGLIESNNPTTVGIAWGIFATSPLTIIAGGLFTLATMIMGFCSLPFAGFIFPIIALAVPFILYAANRHANNTAKQRTESGEIMEQTRCIQNDGFDNLNNYQNGRLRHWVKNNDDMNAWLSNSDRNTFGYIAMPLLGISGLITTIAVTASAHLIPAFMFGAALSVFPPVGLGILLAVAVLAACIHLYAKHKTQVPGKPYRLDYRNQAPSLMPSSAAHSSKLRLTSTHGHLSKVGISPNPICAVSPTKADIPPNLTCAVVPTKSPNQIPTVTPTPLISDSKLALSSSATTASRNNV